LSANAIVPDALRLEAGVKIGGKKDKKRKLSEPQASLFNLPF